MGVIATGRFQNSLAPEPVKLGADGEVLSARASLYNRGAFQYIGSRHKTEVVYAALLGGRNENNGSNPHNHYGVN